MAITSSIPGVSQGGLKVTLASVDITSTVQEETIDIADTLGQGAGSGSGSSARATTCSFLSTLGPISTAVGSGTIVHTPQLVRNGELIIYDANNVKIFGGYASKYSDVTAQRIVYTKIDAYDYWQALARINVNISFSGQTDIQMIGVLLETYAPFIDRSLIPTSTGFSFTIKNFRNVTLQSALQTIADTTGWLMWIDPYRKFHYSAPNQGSTSPFALSTSPDFRTSYQYRVDDYEQDDTAAINRVTFYGGKKLTSDFTQELTTQVSGTNTVFVLAYYPEVSSSGKVIVKVNGVTQILGSATSTGAANTLISKGGTAQVLLDADAKSLTFSTAPAAGATVSATYRYQLPLITVLTDETSRQFFGGYFDGTISDETIFDIQQAVQRSRVLLLEQSFGLVTMKVTCWKAGIQVGQTIRLDHSVRNLHRTYQVQEVHTTPVGNGQFKYEVSLGAWNWNLVDIFKKSIQMATPQDTTTDAGSATSIDVKDGPVNASAQYVVVIATTKSHGLAQVHSSPLGTSSDAYAGFSSLSG